MSNKVQHYSLYEGNFLTTAPVLDRSVNVLMFRDPDTVPRTKILSRSGRNMQASVKSEKKITTIR